MYTFITGCLHNFLCRSHTPLHPNVTSSRRDRLLFFIRTRPWFDSDNTQRAFPFTASNALCLLMHVLTPSIHAAVIIRYCCVIRHECVLWSPYSPRCFCTYLAHTRHDYCISPSGVLSTFTCGNFTTWSNVWTRHKKRMIYMRHKERM